VTPLFFRCEAGEGYGLGHAMRVRTIARALHALHPGRLLHVVGHTTELCTIFAHEPVIMHIVTSATDCVQFPYDGPLVVDLPFGCLEDRFRFAGNRTIIRIDAPWATPVTCDAVALPGMHHSIRTVEKLLNMFGKDLLWYDMPVLREDLPAVVSWDKRHASPCVAFFGGSGDTLSILSAWYGLATERSPDAAEMQYRYFAKHASLLPVEPFSLKALSEAILCVCAWGTTVYECLALGTPVVIAVRDDATFYEATCLHERFPSAVRAVLRMTDGCFALDVQAIAREPECLCIGHMECLQYFHRNGAAQLASWISRLTEGKPDESYEDVV